MEIIYELYILIKMLSVFAVIMLIFLRKVVATIFESFAFSRSFNLAMAKEEKEKSSLYVVTFIWQFVKLATR